jgi:hypothetical protein
LSAYSSLTWIIFAVPHFQRLAILFSYSFSILFIYLIFSLVFCTAGSLFLQANENIQVMNFLKDSDTFRTRRQNQSSLPRIVIRGTLALALLGKSSVDAQSVSFPITDGLVGAYNAQSWNATGKYWADISGKGNDAKEVKGTPKVSSDGRDLTGERGDGLKFPNVIGHGKDYTLFFAAKYNGDNKARIFDGSDENWLSGFWAGRSGIAHHNGWVAGSNDLHGSARFVGTDQKKLFRSDGITRGTGGGGAAPSQITVQYGRHTGGELSNWAIRVVLLYNRELNMDEIQSTEGFLKEAYMGNFEPSDPFYKEVEGEILPNPLPVTGIIKTPKEIVVTTTLDQDSGNVTDSQTTFVYSSSNLGGRKFWSYIPVTPLEAIPHVALLIVAVALFTTSHRFYVRSKSESSSSEETRLLQKPTYGALNV